MRVIIDSVDHKDQRYETTGDWWWENPEKLHIRVSRMGDWKKEMLIAHHELTEALLCKAHGVQPSEVDAFDISYEATREAGDDSEPGDDKEAPYYREHQTATGFERVLAVGLGVDWHEYEQSNLDLYED